MPRIIGQPPEREGRHKVPKPEEPRPDHGRSAPPLLLYIHFPFCRGKCLHCGFHSQAYNEITLAWYLKLLLEEIRLWGERLDGPPIKTLYLGGGTPSLLTPGQLHQILDAVHARFRPVTGLETTLEANPDSALDEGFHRRLLSLGVNRLSIGVQSLDDRDLELLGRPHTARHALDAYAAARRAGFANVSLDLIWGLPGQRLKTWLKQLEAVMNLGPEHISCYGLTVEPGTSLESMVAEGIELPEEGEQARMFVYGAEYLEAQGYLQYEISNFARMGYMSLHNLGYWEGADYLGLGPSAVSTLGRRRFRNPAYMDEYDVAVRTGGVGHDHEVLDPATRVREMVMLQLRTTRGLDLREYTRRTGSKLTETHPALLKALRANKLIRINQGRLALTKAGMAVSNVIIERLALSAPEAPGCGGSGPETPGPEVAPGPDEG